MDVQPAGSAKADKTHGWLERVRLVLFLKEEYDTTMRTMERNSAYMYASVCMRMCICMRISNCTYLDNYIYSTYACLCVLHVDAYVLYVICICMCVRVRVHFGIRRRMMRAVNCRIGRISSSRPNIVFGAEFRLRG